jgi:hypothetical protein
MCQHTHGSTGICGIVYIDGGVWGPEWDDHLFLGNVVTSKINHDHVTFTGSTPKANEQPDFLTSDDPWFRPVDLTLGPDTRSTSPTSTTASSATTKSPSTTPAATASAAHRASGACHRLQPWLRQKSSKNSAAQTSPAVTSPYARSNDTPLKTGCPNSQKAFRTMSLTNPKAIKHQRITR